MTENRKEAIDLLQQRFPEARVDRHEPNSIRLWLGPDTDARNDVGLHAALLVEHGYVVGSFDNAGESWRIYFDQVDRLRERGNE